MTKIPHAKNAKGAKGFFLLDQPKNKTIHRVRCGRCVKSKELPT